MHKCDVEARLSLITNRPLHKNIPKNVSRLFLMTNERCKFRKQTSKYNQVILFDCG